MPRKAGKTLLMDKTDKENLVLGSAGPIFLLLSWQYLIFKVRQCRDTSIEQGHARKILYKIYLLFHFSELPLKIINSHTQSICCYITFQILIKSKMYKLKDKAHILH